VLIKNYGVYVDSNSFLQDNSLVRWNGFAPYPQEVDNTDDEVEQDAEEYENYESSFTKDMPKEQLNALIKSKLAQVDTFKTELNNNLNTEFL